MPAHVVSLVLVLLAAPGARARAAVPPPSTSIRIEDPALQYLVDRLAPTLAANDKAFAGKTGPVRGFGAGTTYPQIWLRDSATLQDVSRFHFGRAHLASWIEEHLAHQRPDGSLFDWIAAGPTSSFVEWAPKVRRVHRAGALEISADKNDVEADQEASAVIAAGRFLAFTGDAAWLRRDVAGRRVLERCDAALSYVLKERRDSDTGLITSAFTADWGDVTPIHPDQRVIYLDEKTPRVVGLYTNALASEAARALAAMHGAAGDEPRAQHWRAEAARVAAALDRALWQPRRGFYRMHAPAPGPAFKADDADIFAMGGHAVAILAGLADPPRAARILDLLDARRRELKLSTASFTLLPPFPAGLFQHPMVKEPWTYQNGGQWDWFGGRWVLAEFENGRAERAREDLWELARKAQKSGGLYEWHTRDGEGRGSPQYAGSAGALGAAVIRGLLGISLRADRLELSPRVGTIPASVRLHEPATGTLVEYEYKATATARALRFKVQPPRRTRISILIPSAWKKADIVLDSQETPGELVEIGADRYLRVETDGKAQEVLVKASAPRSKR